MRMVIPDLPGIKVLAAAPLRLGFSRLFLIPTVDRLLRRLEMEASEIASLLAVSKEISGSPSLPILLALVTLESVNESRVNTGHSSGRHASAHAGNRSTYSVGMTP